MFLLNNTLQCETVISVLCLQKCVKSGNRSKPCVGGILASLSSHFAIASLFFAQDNRAFFHLDLSISNTSSLGASYHTFTLRCSRWRERRLDQHTQPHFISIAKNLVSTFCYPHGADKIPSHREASFESVFPPKLYLGRERCFNLFAN